MFPKQPYEVQMQIAKKIYEALEDASQKIMIIESPTGTGKTYSLLVPTMYWLAHNKDKMPERADKKTGGLPVWISKAHRPIAETLLKERRESEAKLVNWE